MRDGHCHKFALASDWSSINMEIGISFSFLKSNLHGIETIAYCFQSMVEESYGNLIVCNVRDKQAIFTGLVSRSMSSFSTSLAFQAVLRLHSHHTPRLSFRYSPCHPHLHIQKTTSASSSDPAPPASSNPSSPSSPYSPTHPHSSSPTLPFSQPYT